MTLLDLLIFAAATWYISYVITSTSGPFHIFVRLREFKGGRWHGRNTVPTKVTLSSVTGDSEIETEIIRDGLLDCIICTSIWVAIILVLIGMNIITQALAVAGVALWIHAYTGWKYNA